MSANPSALTRLWTEFDRIEPDARLNGIFVAKRGYHNTRNNHLAGRNGGSPSDYSVTDTPLDLQGPGDKAAAIDINMESARLRSDFRTMDKYCSRLLTAFQNRDPRLFYQGKPVVREFFGNSDLDREVEGWSLFRNRAATSDTTHLWHIHISFHRWAVENWAAVSGVLAVLVGTTLPAPEPLPVEDEVNLDDKIKLTEGERAKYPGFPAEVTVRTLLLHAGAGGWEIEREQQNATGIEGRRYDALLANVQQNETAIHQLAAQVAELLARLEATHPVGPEPPVTPTTYTVQPGDTLGGIAQRLDVDLDELAEANDISDPDRIFPGQVLTIPAP